ncbi:efflux RND transporter periplasmic adaptor subunit (plasmid) [Scandinavium goeteborgense]|nr:efflux RND transporter periplasmic adaptor subunit [Scandinavium goeteborgense]
MLLIGCDDDSAAKKLSPPPRVIVITARQSPLKIDTLLPGRTSAWRVADVRPQVSGIILKRNFVEGSEVKRGESLYKIDPANYQASLVKAKSELLQAQASAHIAHLKMNRYQTLLASKYVSQQEFDTAQANTRQADANVTSAKAGVNTAQIQLNYTDVASPISGWIGKSNLTEGALVTVEQSNSLATVQQLDPIYVDLTQSSEEFTHLKQAISNGQVEKTPETKVSLTLENGEVYPLKGHLEFSDVTVDQRTGSISLRAVFPNPQHSLLPGMFVRAKVDEGIKQDAILIPQQAVTRNPRGEAVVMVVNSENKAERRTVATSKAIGDSWLISKGLSEGDKVIVSGLQKVKPGNAVQPETPTPAKASAS